MNVVGQPVVYVAGFVVLLALGFARPWAEGLIRLVQLGGLAVAVVLFGNGVRGLQLQPSTTKPGGGMVHFAHLPGHLGRAMSIGLLAPPLLGLAGVYLVLAGRAWSLLWAVLVLLFAAYLKAHDWFTVVVVLLAGAGIGLAATVAGPAVQTAVAVGVVWWLLIGGVTTLTGIVLHPFTPNSPQLGTTAFIPGQLGVAVLWAVSLVVLWVGARRLLGI